MSADFARLICERATVEVRRCGICDAKVYGGSDALARHEDQHQYDDCWACGADYDMPHDDACVRKGR